jgi:hypothetical protein
MIGDDPDDPDVIGQTHWNADHTLTMASGRVLGLTTVGDGPVEELDAAGCAAAPVGLAIDDTAEVLRLVGLLPKASRHSPRLPSDVADALAAIQAMRKKTAA